MLCCAEQHLAGMTWPLPPLQQYEHDCPWDSTYTTGFHKPSKWAPLCSLCGAFIARRLQTSTWLKIYTPLHIGFQTERCLWYR